VQPRAEATPIAVFGQTYNIQQIKRLDTPRFLAFTQNQSPFKDIPFLIQSDANAKAVDGEEEEKG
jgi:hypothetical protein